MIQKNHWQQWITEVKKLKIKQSNKLHLKINFFVLLLTILTAVVGFFIMTNVIVERKERLLKTLALFGLFGILLLIAWLSVQIVNILPKAVSSLASLADSVYSYDPRSTKNIPITSTQTGVPSGDEFNLSWEQRYKTGTYSFSFECADEVRASIYSSQSEFKEAECNKQYNLGNVENATIVFLTNATDTIAVPYTLTYFKTNDTQKSAESTGLVTIHQGRTGTAPEPSVTVTVNDDPITPKETVAAKPITTKPASKPETIYTYTYSLPVSDPKGKTDLSVGYLGIGQVVNGNFISTGTIKEGQKGALQFTVTNIGTKTSADWTFEANLPGGVKYTSEKQSPLKPNEKATLTIIFPEVNDETKVNFSFEVNSTGESNTKNNNLAWTTSVTR